jgi:septation ring formation regulator EzrA
MSGGNGFTDREAGRIERRLKSLEQSVDKVADKMDEFMDDEYSSTEEMVERHRTWLQMIWGIITTIGAGLVSIAVWIVRGKFG